MWENKYLSPIRRQYTTIWEAAEKVGKVGFIFFFTLEFFDYYNLTVSINYLSRNYFLCSYF